MPDLKVGTVVHFERLSSILVTFRVAPEKGTRFPAYEAGQYIALRKDNCKLTKLEVEADGKKRYVLDVDGSGAPKIGTVTHSYSIASAPFESQEKGHLEFYVVLEKDEYGIEGRLSKSLLSLSPAGDNAITYVNKITGNFTLPKTAKGFDSVVLVGTGTGLAPFVSMVKQLDFEARNGRKTDVKYTLVHTNRILEELAYHRELVEIEKARRFDFAYIPTVSRPTERDMTDPTLGRGRANNVLRHMFGMPLKEEQTLQEKLARGEDGSRARAALDKATKPALPTHHTPADLQKRFAPTGTVILTCGNPSLMEDIKHIADANRIKFDKEDW